MSKQVDERVLSMQFDNKNFEKNVSTTMSTLDKFKQKLDLKGASKGLENVNSAAKKVDMNGLANGVETVRSKFSALEVMGVTALANITNSAVNAAKNFVSALTVAPIKDGWQEYEMTINSIQTTMAGTGKTAEEVEKELKKLDEYADKTVYSTADMLNNLPKFTNAGVELEKATSAMIGIANATALAGGDASKASIAFYNLGQAIGTGYLTRMDYNSINNAGIATMEWKEAMVEAAIAAGTLEKVGEDSYQAGNKTLTLQQLFIDGLQEQWATTEVMMKVFGDYGDETTEIGKKSYAAAQDIKTFSMMMDSLKATAGTGWKDTWQIVFGGLDEAKKFWTGLANFISGILTKMSDARNRILEIALDFAKPWQALSDKLKGLTNITDKLKGAAKSLEYFQDIVNKVWRGDYNNWGDNPDRFDLLEAAGYDHRVVQDLVNKGYRYKLTMEDIEASHKKFGLTMATTTEETEDLTKAINELTDEQLEKAGLTEEEIRLYRALEKEAKRLGITVSDLAEEMSNVKGRDLLIGSFKDIGSAIMDVGEAIKEAWIDIFNPPSAEEIGIRLYGIIRTLKDFTESLRVNEETAENVRRTFKGLFAALDIILTIIGGPIKIVFKILGQLLSALDIDIWWLTAHIGDAIVAFRDWIDSVFDFTKVFEFIAPYIKDAVRAIGDWIAETKPLEKASEIFSKLGVKIKEAFTAIKESEFGQVAKNIILGLINGLKDGTITVGKAIWNIGKTILDKIKEVLGIHSPSTEFIEIGKNIMAGLIVGIGSVKLLSVVANIAKAIGGLGDVLEGVGEVLGGVGRVLWKSAGGIRKILNASAKVVRKFAKTLGSVGNLINAKALQTLAISIAILAGSVAVLAMMDPGRVWSAVGVIVVLAGVLGGLMAAVNKFGMAGPTGIKDAITGVKQFGQLAASLLMISGSLLLLAISLKIIGGMEWSELGVAAAGIVLLGLVLAGLMRMTKYSGERLYMLKETIVALGGAMLMLSVAMRIIGGMEWRELGVAAAGIVLLGLVVAGLIWSTKLAGPLAGTIGKTILSIAGAIAILAIAMRIIGGMEWDSIGKAAVGIGGLAIIMVLLMKAVKSAGPNPAAIGGTLLAIAGAMAILTITAKIIAGMEWGSIVKAAVGLAGLVLIIRMMIQAVKLAGPNVAKIGGTLLAISGAMLILTFTAKMIAGMDWGGIAKAAVGLVGLVLIIRMMIQAVKLAGNQAPKIALTLLALSAAIGILAGVAVLLSLVEIGALAKGVIAVGFLGAIMTAMIKATRGAQDCMKNLIVMTVAIAVMAGAIAGLSFIDPTKLASASLAIGLVMGMFAIMMKASSSVGKGAGTIAVMIGVIAIMAGALYLIGQLPVENSLAAAVGLSVLMLALSASLVVLSTIGKFTKDALLGVLALLAMAVPLLAFVGILALMQNIQNVIPSVMALVTLTTAMTLLLIPLTIVGAFGMAGLPYLGVLALLAMAVPLLAFVGILALMQNIQNATQNALILVTLMKTMTACLVAISLVAPLALIAVGAITALVGVITGMSVLLTAIGALVTKFPQLETFLDTGISLLEKLANGIGSILGNFISGFAVSAMSGLPEMGELLSDFMEKATPFIDGAKNLDPSTMDGVKALAEVILILTAADVIQGLTSWLTGGSSITQFGEEIAAFGPSLKKFADSVAGIDGTSVQAAANAAKALAEMTATIPNEGGVVGWFTGENSITKFADELPNLGTKLKTFSDNVAGINAENINAAVEAAKGIAEMTSTIPNEGGVAGWFSGENSISKFADELPLLAGGLKGFSDGVEGINTENINSAVTAANAIVEMTSNIPNEGGVVSWFTGDNSISKFGDQLGNLGTAISDFSINVGQTNVENINKAVKATKALAELLATDITKNTSGMTKFGDRLVKFGKKLSEFCAKMDKIKDESISSAIDKFNKIVDVASSLSADSITSINSFADALVNVAKNGINEFIKTLNSKDVKTDAKEAVSDLVDSTADSIETLTNKLKFQSAGKYLVQGLAKGIRDNKPTATKAAQEVADAVESIIRAAWQVNSPSKLFYKIALGVGEGIEYAFADSTNNVKSSAGDLASTASNGFSKAISQITDMINSDMDTQPTIRPVLDLSDVQSGANSIAGMFAGNRTLAVSAPGVGAISASMASRQNGNHDLISAINKLVKSNNGKAGNTYNFNGITYDDGSNISDAVETLVRAAQIERRT